MKCKVCGKDAVEINKEIILTTYPEKFATKCKNCGHIDYIDCKDAHLGDMISMPSIKMGWECPRCGAVMSPNENACINCKGITTAHSGLNGTIQN